MITDVRKAFRETAHRLVGLVLVLAVFLCYLTLPPAEWWIRVDKISVEDGNGIDSKMVVDRTIVRPFVGIWSMSLMRRGPDGSFYTVCVARSDADLRAGQGLPEDLTVGKWLRLAQGCDFRPGIYKVRVLWIVASPYFVRKEVRAESNSFVVK